MALEVYPTPGRWRLLALLQFWLIHAVVLRLNKYPFGFLHLLKGGLAPIVKRGMIFYVTHGSK